MRQLIPPDIRELVCSSKPLQAVLLTDLLTLLAELGAVVTIPWWITSLGGAQAISAFGVTVAAATFLAAPALSPFGDRFCKGRQITWGLALLCVVCAVELALARTGMFNLGLLLALAIAQVVGKSFVDPARDTVLTGLLLQEQLPVAIRARKTTQAVGGIVGPLLAGATLGWLGVSGALGIVCGLLLAATLMATRIPRQGTTPMRRGGVAVWWRDLRSGLAAKWFVPMVRGWTIVNFTVWIFQGPAVGLLIPIKVHALGLQGDWLGLSLCTLSTGVLLGSAFGSGALVNVFGRYRVRIGLGVVEGISFVVVGFADSPALLLVGLVLAGFCNASMGLVGATHRALAIPKAYRVRMYAAASMSTQAAGAIGSALVGVALRRMNVAVVYQLWGTLMATCVLGFLLVPRLKEFLTLRHEQIGDWYQREYPDIFK